MAALLRLAILSSLLAACSNEHGATPGPDGAVTPPGDATGDAGVAPLAVDQPGIYEMAVDDKFLYWIDDGQFDHVADVRRMPQDGGPIETLASLPERVYSLAVADGFVYFVQTGGALADYAGHVYKVPVAGGTPIALATAFNPTSVSVDGGWVYYSEAISPGGRIMRVPVGGGPAEVAVDDVDNPWDLVADGGAVFYSEMNRGRMMRAVPGQAPVELAAGWIGTGWMTLDATTVYFSACESGDCTQPKLFAVPRDGGAAQMQLVGVSGAAKLASAGDHVQWGAEVLSTSGAGVRAFPGSASPFAVATTDKAVFFGDLFTGAIFRAQL